LLSDTIKEISERPPKRYISLRLEITAATIVLIVAVTAILSSFSLHYERQALRHEFISRILAQTRSVAATSSGSILLDIWEAGTILQPLAQNTIKDSEDCTDITIVDKNEIIRGAKETISLNKTYQPQEGLKAIDGEFGQLEGETIAEKDSSIYIKAPIKKGELGTIGYVYAVYDSSKLSKMLALALQNLIIISGVVLLAGMGGAYLVSLMLVGPVRRLADAARQIGQGNFDVSVNTKSSNELGQLAETFNQTAKSLKEAQKMMLEKNRMEQELTIARQLQHSFLPDKFPRRANLDIYGHCRTAQAVGGDYYDVLELDKDNIGLIIADISGKGLSGLLVMSMVRNVLRSQAQRYQSPRRALIETNLLLMPDFQKGRFVTSFLGIYNLPNRLLTYANAGHCPLIYYRAKDNITAALEKSGRPIGLFSSSDFDARLEEGRLELGNDDFILLFTDGITEARNGLEDPYGEQRLLELIPTLRDLSSRRIVEEIFSQVNRFCGKEGSLGDDITIMVMKVTEDISAPEENIPAPAAENA
jgi:serine phosphatase RsbU (regulator of sigma subunit)